MSLIMMNPRHQRSPRNLTLNDVYPHRYVDYDSVFSGLSYWCDDLPWSGIDPVFLDFAYQGQRSGNKFIAPFMYDLLDANGHIDNEGLGASFISKAIEARYFQKWKHLWELYTTEYSPLNTYNITESGEKTEEESIDESDARTLNLTDTHTGTDNLTKTNDESNRFVNGHVITDSGTDTTTTDYGRTTTDSGTDTTTTEYGKITTDEGEPSKTTNNQVYGFNSVDPSNASKSVENSVTDNTQTLSGSDSTDVVHGMVETLGGTDEVEVSHGKVESHSGTDITTVDQDGTENRTLNLSDAHTGTDSNVRTGSNTLQTEFSTTKRGTMYRSPAELMSLDREFWLEEYFGIVFADVDHMLTLGIYSERDPNTKVF